MFKICALNNTGLENDNQEDSSPFWEVLEANAAKIHQDAISHLANNQLDKAKECFLQVLENPYINKASSENIHDNVVMSQERALKYSSLKNVGGICMKHKNYEEACKYYLQAVNLDSSEVLIWQKLGISAIRNREIELALSALQEGLKINPNHWPCLDQLLSVLYLLGFQEDCLGLCIKLLKRDPNYVKALAFKDRIFKDQPHIVGFIKSFYLQSDILFRETTYDSVKGDEYIANCMKFRPKPSERKVEISEPPKNICNSLKNLTWEDLGITLRQTYDEVIEKEVIAFASKVDLETSLKSCLLKKFGVSEETIPSSKVNRSLSYDENKIGCGTSSKDAGASTSESNSTRRNTIEVCHSAEGLLTTVESISNAAGSTMVLGTNLLNSPNPKVSKFEGTEPSVELKDVEMISTTEESTTPHESSNHLCNKNGVLETKPALSPITEKPEESVASSFRNTDDDVTVGIGGRELMKEVKITAVDETCGEPIKIEQDCKSPQRETTPFNIDPNIKPSGDVTESDSYSVSTDNKMPVIDQKITKDNNIVKEHSGSEEGHQIVDGSINRQTVDNNITETTDLESQTTVVETSESCGGPHANAIPTDDAILTNDLADSGVASFVREIGQFFADQEMNFIIAEPDAGGPASDGERNSASDPDKHQDVDSCSKDSENSSDSTNDPKSHPSAGKNLKPKKTKVNLTPEMFEGIAKDPLSIEIGPSEVYKMSAKTSGGAHSSPKKSPKKSKRPKRGLERELEQLDYWGRRKAREAKRRRKTITSKLVGVFEDGEYLSLNHLFRSFIPAALISSDDTNKSATPKKYKEGVGLCSTITSPEKSTRKRKLSDASKPEQPSKKSKVCHQEALASLDNDERKYVTDAIGQSTDHSQFEWSLEEFQVTKFVSQYENRFNILDLILMWEATMLNFFGKVWPKNVAVCFNDIYLRSRNHVWKGLDMSESSNRLIKLGTTAITNLELAISLFLCASEDPTDSEKADIRKKLDCDFIDDDILYLGLLCGRCDLWKEDFLQVNLRLRWIEAQVNLIKEKANETAIILQVLHNEMQLSCRDNEDICIERCRVEGDNITVNSSQVQYQLNVLQRSSMLEGVSSKYDSGCYDEVVQILSATFDKSTPMVASSSTNVCPSRRTQLLLLVKALHNQDDFTGVVDWSGVCLAEAMQSYRKLLNDDEQDRRAWAESISTIIKFTYESYINDKFDKKNLGKQSLPRLVACLMEVIVLQLEQNPSMTHLYFGSVVPWMLVHAILCRHENQSSDAMETDATESNHQNEASKEQTFSSTLFLITAHEELGKNGWCGLECGNFLIYMCDILIKELSRPLSQDQYTTISRALEQTTYCLYSHPQRRTKHKHLRDHGIQPVFLTWTQAVKLYKFYYPTQLPDFQSSDIPSINEDLAVFIKRFISLYPDSFNGQDDAKKVEHFLSMDDPGDIYPESAFSTDLENAHYIIADYHFKNKEWDLAIEYYRQDVAINTGRLESWAAMGLSKKAQLETLLNSCDVIKNLGEFFNKSQVAIRCLNRALVLDRLHYNLWVERGALLFMTHSHASRTLKQDINPLMSMELFASLERIKSSALEESKTCFVKAIHLFEQETDEMLTDERWLYHYMLGKVAEKDGSGARCVIECYVKASECLHHAGAKYPTRISYNNPQENSIEALEIYFRVFAYVLKYLTHREQKTVDGSTLKYFQQVLAKFSVGPFVTQKEHKVEKLDQKVDRSPDGDGVRGFMAKMAEQIVSRAVEKTFDIVDSGADIDSQTDPINVSDLVDSCLTAMKLCMTRFPHHYKSLYRIAHYYYHSSVRKDAVRARNFILGCPHWQKLDYMPVNGLFNDRKIILQTPRACNFFNGVWRIPNDEIDRPGSFAAQMYKCICMLLDVLTDLKDFFCIFEIAFALKFSPDKDKKYLRDNERELLSEHATQVGIQSLKDKHQQIFQNSSSPSNYSRRQSFILEVYKASKHISRHLPGTEALLAKTLTESYASINGLSVDANPALLREAELFCSRNLTASRQQLKPQTNSSLTPVVPGAVRRGRPLGPAKPKNLKLDPQVSASSTQIQAVQQAYKVYENFAQAQTLLTSSKNADPKVQQHHRKICDGYQKQLMQYLQIPSVSHYFSSSLQTVGSTKTKLPPPTPKSHEDPILASLTAKCQSNGLSVTTVPRKDTQPPVSSVPKLALGASSSKPKPAITSHRSSASIDKHAATTITPRVVEKVNHQLSVADPLSTDQTTPCHEDDPDPDITFIVPPDPLSIEDEQPRAQNMSEDEEIIILD